MTVLELIQRGTDYLTQKGVESPRLQIELLVSHALRLRRLDIYLNFERQVTVAEADAIREMVRRRSQREPLQHIIGTACFCGIDFEVNRSVLVPRPETELLAEAGWLFLQSLPPGRSEASTALDLGTGSGCLAVTLASRCPSARIDAVDLSRDALEVARRNARRCGVDSQITFHNGDLFVPLIPAARFDLVISNPPYIPSHEVSALEPEVRDYDPPIALHGGADGLDFYRRLASNAASFLKSGGRLMVELGDGQAEPVRHICGEHGWVVDKVQKDYSGCDRILIAHR